MQSTKSLHNLHLMIRSMLGAGNISTLRDEAEAELQHIAGMIQPGANAVERLDTAPPGKGVNEMMQKLTLSHKLSLIPTLLHTMNTMTQCAETMKHPQNPTQQTADGTFLAQIEQFARKNGAIEVGFVRIPPDDIFEGYALPYQNAIIFTVDMEAEAINTAPSYEALREVLKTYGALGELALKLSNYLHENGYGAYPGFPIGGMVDYVRVAQAAGIGAIGYHGLLISPSDGTRQRINVVYTNMDAPDVEEYAHDWVLDFCAVCNRCVRECPPSAIYTDGETNPVTGRKATLHYDKCLDYYADNHGCAVCVKVCPFSHAGYDKVKSGFMKTLATT